MSNIDFKKIIEILIPCRDIEEAQLALKNQNINLSFEELEDIKREFNSQKQNSAILSLDQLDNVAGGVVYKFFNIKLRRPIPLEARGHSADPRTIPKVDSSRDNLSPNSKSWPGAIPMPTKHESNSSILTTSGPTPTLDPLLEPAAHVDSITAGDKSLVSLIDGTPVFYHHCNYSAVNYPGDPHSGPDRDLYSDGPKERCKQFAEFLDSNTIKMSISSWSDLGRALVYNNGYEPDTHSRGLGFCMSLENPNGTSANLIIFSRYNSYSRGSEISVYDSSGKKLNQQDTQDVLHSIHDNNPEVETFLAFNHFSLLMHSQFDLTADGNITANIAPSDFNKLGLTYDAPNGETLVLTYEMLQHFISDGNITIDSATFDRLKFSDRPSTVSETFNLSIDQSVLGKLSVPFRFEGKEIAINLGEYFNLMDFYAKNGYFTSNLPFGTVLTSENCIELNPSRGGSKAETSVVSVFNHLRGLNSSYIKELKEFESEKAARPQASERTPLTQNSKEKQGCCVIM